MEKIPGKPQEFMGIQEFDTKLEYVFLCLILIYLEERTRGEQFILSGLIDYIQNLVAEVDINDIKIDFTIYSQRKSMVKVLKFIKEMGFIKLYDGDENKFAAPPIAPSPSPFGECNKTKNINKTAEII